MRASWFSSSSSTLRVSSRIVLRSSRNSTCGNSASASLMTCATLLTLSRLNLTYVSLRMERNLEHSFVFSYQLRFHLSKHLLVIGSALLHLFGIGLENDSYLVINAVFQRQLLEQHGVHTLGDCGRCLGPDKFAGDQFFGDLAG